MTNVFAAAASVTLILASWGVLQLWGLGAAAFHTKAEPREGLVVLEIVRRGDWLLPRRNGVELPAKPPLFHWLGAVVSLLHGKVDEWSVRLPSALLSLIAVLVVFLTGTLLWGVRPALLAALALLTSFEWLRAATSARVDMTLTFGLTLAFCGLLLLRVRDHPSWLVLVYLGTAWAVLAKGPVGIALPALQVAAVTAVDRNFDYVRGLRVVRGMIFVGFIAAAWYIAAWTEGGRQFFETQVLKENVYRFVGTHHFTAGHRHSISFLLFAFLGGFLPWSFFLPGVGASLWRRRTQITRRDGRWFALLWIIIVFAFYASATSKRGVYLLALYPAAVLLIGWWWDAIIREPASARAFRLPLAAVAWCAGLLFAIAGLCAAAHAAGIPVFGTSLAQTQEPEAQMTAALGEHAALLAVLLGAAMIAAVIAALSASAARWGVAYIGVFALLCVLSVLARQVVLPAFSRAVTRETFLQAVLRLVPDRSQVSSYRHFDYGLAFYWGGDLPVTRPPLAAATSPYIVMAEREWTHLAPNERGTYERVPGLRSGRAGNFGELVLLHRLGRAINSASQDSPAVPPQ